MLKKNSKIYVAGHNGLVGSAIVRVLKKNNYKNILTISRSKLDLTNQKKVENFFRKKQIKVTNDYYNTTILTSNGFMQPFY